MKLNKITKVHNGRFLHQYELEYTNKADKQKCYEIASYNDINSPEDLGRNISGVAIVATMNNKLLLLKEFRMAINDYVFNLCAGRIEKNETLEDCIRRELYEETGLELASINKILNPAYAAVGLSDISNQMVFVTVKGTISDHTSPNEEIQAALYTKDEIKALLENCKFATRAQLIAYIFAYGTNDFCNEVKGEL